MVVNDPEELLESRRLDVAEGAQLVEDQTAGSLVPDPVPRARIQQCSIFPGRGTTDRPLVLERDKRRVVIGLSIADPYLNPQNGHRLRITRRRRTTRLRDWFVIVRQERNGCMNSANWSTIGGLERLRWIGLDGRANNPSSTSLLNRRR